MKGMNKLNKKEKKHLKENNINNIKQFEETFRHQNKLGDMRCLECYKIAKILGLEFVGKVQDIQIQEEEEEVE